MQPNVAYDVASTLENEYETIGHNRRKDLSLPTKKKALSGCVRISNKLCLWSFTCGAVAIASLAIAVASIVAVIATESNQTIQALQLQWNDSNEDIQEILLRLNNHSLALRTRDNSTNTEFDVLHEKLCDPLREEVEDLIQKALLGLTRDTPATSCKDIPSKRPSGEYWIKPNNSSAHQVYCDMDKRSCRCSTMGGWMRVANLDMTDPNQTCPDGFRLVSRAEPPLHTCGRPGPVGCVSITFSTLGVEYRHVCGSITGYQFATPEAFGSYHRGTATNINSYYVAGVSITHGQLPRQHIWTFAAALDESSSSKTIYQCPCTRQGFSDSVTVPSFIGNDYFCDTGARDRYQFVFYPDDPLWDGQGCGGTSTCCEFNSPPWFCKQLPQPTTDDIELRLCADQETSNEDTPLERVEMYVH